MEAVIFAGLQASGKSTFYKTRFADTHVRINLDMLKSRYRESKFIETCLTTRQPFVIDNTNPSVKDRTRYFRFFLNHRIKVVGYFFESIVNDCLYRNDSRPLALRVPKVGILGTFKKLTVPTIVEGFDQLWSVRIDVNNGFILKEIKSEV